MEADRKDFKNSATVRQMNREREMMPLIRVLQGAAPIMHEVTGSPAWDRYLTILQGFVERIKMRKTLAQARFEAPDVWEYQQILKLKNDILVADAMLDILRTAMELPKALIEGGQAAQEIVSQFEAKHASTAEKTQP